MPPLAKRKVNLSVDAALAFPELLVDFRGRHVVRTITDQARSCEGCRPERGARIAPLSLAGWRPRGCTTATQARPRCQGSLAQFPGLLTSRWAASRFAPERFGSRLAHVQCNRSPTGQPSTWAGTGDRCFPVGRQAKGVEPVGPGGSIRKKSFIFNHLEFPEKPLDLGRGEGQELRQ